MPEVAAAAAALRAQHFSYADIAYFLGLGSPQAARRAVQCGLDRRPNLEEENRQMTKGLTEGERAANTRNAELQAAMFLHVLRPNGESEDDQDFMVDFLWSTCENELAQIALPYNIAKMAWEMVREGAGSAEDYLEQIIAKNT